MLSAEDKNPLPSIENFAFGVCHLSSSQFRGTPARKVGLNAAIIARFVFQTSQGASPKRLEGISPVLHQVSSTYACSRQYTTKALSNLYN